MSQSDSSVSARLGRLSQSCALLGEPDIISIKQIRSSSSFFQKEKKSEDVQENFINGLIFPTTAHFSSFISTRYKGKDPAKISIRAKLFMFDAFAEKDIHIQVSIPGSLEARTYNLKGQAVAFTPQDYQRAYYSSFLRSLRPMNYPSIILYPLLNRIEILRPILRNFVSFSVKHELRMLGYDLIPGRADKETPRNLALEILLDYLMENRFDQLLKIVLDELRKISPAQTRQLQMESKLFEGKYAQIISKTAEKLLLHGNANQLKQYQLRALIKTKKYEETAFIGQTLIYSGGTTPEIGKLILTALIQSGEQRRFLKTLNLVSNLVNQNQRSLRQVSHIDPEKGKFQLEGYVGKSKNISEYPELCFPFDNTFFNRLIEYQNQRKLLQKNSSKEGLTLGILDKVEESLTNSPLFYDSLVKYEKTKGWKHLLQCRGECFWLESDFAQYEHSIRHSNSQFNDNISFFDHNFDDEDSKEKQWSEEEWKEKQKQQNQEEVEEAQPNQQNQQKISTLEESFDGNLSQHEEQRQIDQMPRCSTRVFAGKVSRVKIEAKILCGGHLERLFLLLFSDIKLQNSLQIWEQKLKQTDSEAFSVGKRELAGMIFLKKGLLHKKLQRNKKCEQALKLARKLSQSPAVSLVATYQLVLLYVDNKNVKGVQFYLVELIKLLKILGIEYFDIVPEWAKPVLQFVAEHEGLSIIKNIHPLFKTVFALYLRSNYSEEEIDKWTQLRRQK